MMDRYYLIRLSKAVPTVRNKGGSKVAVCRAASATAAVAQLIPEMRERVDTVEEYYTLPACYVAGDMTSALKEGAAS